MDIEKNEKNKNKVSEPIPSCTLQCGGSLVGIQDTLFES